MIVLRRMMMPLWFTWSLQFYFVVGWSPNIPPLLRNNYLSCEPISATSATTKTAAAAVAKTTTTITSKKRRTFLENIFVMTAGAATITTMTVPQEVRAAPPFAVISEELGYFPVTTAGGDIIYVPKRVSRESSPQAIELAKKLKSEGVIMYGTFWCPHCARQKELFGRQAWDLIPYSECSPKGYDSKARACIKEKVDGYPTWIFPSDRKKKGFVLSGEQPLEVLAKKVNFAFQPDEEQNVPPPLGSSAACN